MKPSRLGESSGAPPVSETQTGPKFKSVRRVFRIIDLISQRGERLTAKRIARETGTSLSGCYYLLGILADEGYIEKVPHCGGYRIGPAVSLLNENSKSSFDYKTEPVVEELALQTQRQAYSAVLSDGEAEVIQAKVPLRSPPVGVAKGFHGASHALALGKVLLAGMGSEYVERYIDEHGLEAFTPRTIVRPSLLHTHLNKVRLVGVATDLEEFTQNLCSVAALIENKGGRVEGAIGISTTTRRIHDEGKHLVRMVQWAAEKASALLEEGC